MFKSIQEPFLLFTCFSSRWCRLQRQKYPLSLTILLLLYMSNCRTEKKKQNWIEKYLHLYLCMWRRQCLPVVVCNIYRQLHSHIHICTYEPYEHSQPCLWARICHIRCYLYDVIYWHGEALRNGWWHRYNAILFVWYECTYIYVYWLDVNSILCTLALCAPLVGMLPCLSCHEWRTKRRVAGNDKQQQQQQNGKEGERHQNTMHIACEVERYFAVKGMSEAKTCQTLLNELHRILLHDYTNARCSLSEYNMYRCFGRQHARTENIDVSPVTHQPPRMGKPVTGVVRRIVYIMMVFCTLPAFVNLTSFAIVNKK